MPKQPFKGNSEPSGLQTKHSSKISVALDLENRLQRGDTVPKPKICQKEEGQDLTIEKSSLKMIDSNNQMNLANRSNIFPVHPQPHDQAKEIVNTSQSSLHNLDNSSKFIISNHKGKQLDGNCVPTPISGTYRSSYFFNHVK
jgi:hypothetical protein